MHEPDDGTELGLCTVFDGIQNYKHKILGCPILTGRRPLYWLMFPTESVSFTAPQSRTRQECIPVGCVPTAAVGCPTLLNTLPPIGPGTMDTLPLGKDMGPVTRKEPGTRDTLPPAPL